MGGRREWEAKAEVDGVALQPRGQGMYGAEGRVAARGIPSVTYMSANIQRWSSH